MQRFVQEKVISLDVEDDISDVQWLNDSGWSILSRFSIASILTYENGNKTVFLAIADEERFFRVAAIVYNNPPDKLSAYPLIRLSILPAIFICLRRIHRIYQEIET